MSKDSKTDLKPGYYIDWLDDIMIVDLSGTVWLYTYGYDRNNGYKKKWFSGSLPLHVEFMGEL